MFFENPVPRQAYMVREKPVLILKQICSVHLMDRVKPLVRGYPKIKENHFKKFSGKTPPIFYFVL